MDGNPYDYNIRLQYMNEEGKMVKRPASQREAEEIYEGHRDLGRKMSASIEDMMAAHEASIFRYDDPRERMLLAAEVLVLLATDMAAARILYPEMTQLQLNKMAGRVGEEQARIMLENQGMEILGEHVTARVAGEIRYIDKLVRTPGNQVVAVEVKAGNATRGADQLRKDAAMASGGAELGRNAPADLQGVVMPIKTFEMPVPGVAQ